MVPKVLGALIVGGHYLEPTIWRWSWDEVWNPHVPGIGLGEACRLRQLEMAEDELAIAAKRDRLQSLLLEKFPIW